MWFRSDDEFWRHRKVRLLGRKRVSAPAKVAASGLWHLAGVWSSDNLTDGFVPTEQLREWDPTGDLTRRLLDVELFDAVVVAGEAGVMVHDFLDRNPTRVKVLADRERERKKKERARAALASKRAAAGTPTGSPRGTAAGTPGGASRGESRSTRPDPGSPPSSGTPATPPAASTPRAGAATPEGRAAARADIEREVLAPVRHRRGRAAPGDRPLMAPVAGSAIAASARAEQDRLVELGAVQAVPDGTTGPSPPGPPPVPPVDQHEQESA